jgi:RNA polymerase sigma-70 factor (ECF subfamily)
MDVRQVLPLGDRPGRVTDVSEAVAVRIDQHLDAAYRLATVILGSGLEAEDAVAEAALDAWRSRGKLRDLERFDAWFGRILVNACRDRLRSRRRHPVISIEASDVADRSTGADFRHGVEVADAVRRALEVLDPDERIVVALRYWSDLPVDAIAQRTGVPSGTVKSRLSRALGRLRLALGPDEFEQ